MGDRAFETQNQRYRCNLSETAKGLVQVDCTAECEDPEESVRIATTMLVDARAKLRSQGRELVGE